MLFRMILFRLVPVISFRLCKNRRSLQVSIVTLLVVYFVSGVFSLIYLWEREQWKMIITFLMALFPQYSCYLFAFWILFRCALSPWSSRVWNRIYGLSVLITLLGVYLEYVVNPIFLKFLEFQGFY